MEEGAKRSGIKKIQWKLRLREGTRLAQNCKIDWVASPSTFLSVHMLANTHLCMCAHVHGGV